VGGLGVGVGGGGLPAIGAGAAGAAGPPPGTPSGGGGGGGAGDDLLAMYDEYHMLHGVAKAAKNKFKRVDMVAFLLRHAPSEEWLTNNNVSIERQQRISMLSRPRKRKERQRITKLYMDVIAGLAKKVGVRSRRCAWAKCEALNHMVRMHVCASADDPWLLSPFAAPRQCSRGDSRPRACLCTHRAVVAAAAAAVAGLDRGNNPSIRPRERGLPETGSSIVLCEPCTLRCKTSSQVNGFGRRCWRQPMTHNCHNSREQPR
jgi:hypothetical protein